MDVREKLVGLFISTIGLTPTDAEIYANDFIAHGVTMQDGKPLEAFLHPVDAYKGLKAKYLVFKADTGERVSNCFVHRPDKDPAAVEAIRAYARATDNETLAEDIYKWVGKGEPAEGDYHAYLKPCPFCGGEANLLYPCEGVHLVQCTCCGCGTTYTRTEIGAVRMWNRRFGEANNV